MSKRPSPRRRDRRRALYIGPPLEEAGLPLRIRDEANRTGRCPDCGAWARLVPVREGVSLLSFEHEDRCRATLDPYTVDEFVSVLTKERT